MYYVVLQKESKDGVFPKQQVVFKKIENLIYYEIILKSHGCVAIETCKEAQPIGPMSQTLDCQTENEEFGCFAASQCKKASCITQLIIISVSKKKQ